MNFKLGALVCFFGLLAISQIEALHFDCIDTLEDFQLAHWSYSTSNIEYVNHSSDLPDPLNKIEGDGIWSLAGYVLPQSLQFDPQFLVTPHTPFAYVYVKYYTYVVREENPPFAFVNPGQGANFFLKRLNATANFQWGEALIQLEIERLAEIGILVGEFLKYDDYFLVDKLILVQSEQEIVGGIQEIKKLCEGPPPPFKCTENGTFPDPQDCHLFHACQVDNLGRPWDSVFTCPGSTVWCQKEGRCEYENICPCSN